MFGYATDETEECMPLTVVLAHALNRRISDMRKQGALWWARPDSKTQVTEAGEMRGPGLGKGWRRRDVWS